MLAQLFTALCWAILVEAEKELNKIYPREAHRFALNGVLTK